MNKRLARGPATRREKESKISWVIFLSWVLIIGWLGFLVYYWQSGLLHESHNPALVYVDSVLNSTETSLRGGLKHIHLGVPIAHLPGTPSSGYGSPVALNAINEKYHSASSSSSHSCSSSLSLGAPLQTHREEEEE